MLKDIQKSKNISIVIATKKFKIVNILLNKTLFDDNIISIILKYYWNMLDDKRKILFDWIDVSKLKCENLSYNENAVDFLIDNKHKIKWDAFCFNKNCY